MIRIILFSSIFFCLLVQHSVAQGWSSVGRWTKFPKKEDVSYSEINGSCFWNQNWLRARVTMKNGEVFYLPKAKLNLYTEEIHYLNEAGAELAIQNQVNAVAFYSSPDTAKTEIFKSLNSGLLLNDKDAFVNRKEVYVQILVDGKIRLLKMTKVKLLRREADPLTRRMEWNFEPRENYFIEESYDIRPLGSVNKDHLFTLIKKEEGDEEWLKSNKNKLHKEVDIVSFLNYRNSLVK